MKPPPKPASRPDKVSLRRYARLFRADSLSAQPARLYRAWMAEFRTPFFRSYLINQPELIKTVLKDRPDDFPKSDRISEGLRPLLGKSVFLTNGETWKRQRRIIDPAFEGGRLREVFPAMWDAAEATATRLEAQVGQVIEVEVEIGAACTIDKGVTGDTTIGYGTKIDNQVQIAHDTVIGKKCLIASQVGIAGCTVIEDEVTLWGQVGIKSDVTIGKGAVVYAQSGINNDLEPGKTYFGSPATEARDKFRELALLRSLPKLLEKIKK